MSPTVALQRPFRLLLDPGHGGHNRGCRAVASGIHEKEYTLRICEALVKSLGRAKLPLDIAHTRRSDMQISALQRAKWANAWPADLLLSIHANASPGGKQRGFESFVLSNRRRHARRLLIRGPKEPKASNAQEAPYLKRLAAWNEDRIFAQRSHRWALLLQAAQRQNFDSRIDRGVRGGNFDILVECHRPCVLHEIGFLDHRVEGRWMQEKEGIEATIFALHTAVEWILADRGYRWG